MLGEPGGPRGGIVEGQDGELRGGHGRKLPKGGDGRFLKECVQWGRIGLASMVSSRTATPTKDETMGDKSPKAKDKSKKQDAADKSQKAAAAAKKAAPPAPAAAAGAKKGK